MTVDARGCPSCGFSNPRAWRRCARCGRTFTGQRTTVRPTPNPFGSDRESTAVDLWLPLTGTAPDEDTHEAQIGEVAALAVEDLPLIGQQAPAEAVRAGIERAFSVGVPTLVFLEGATGSGKTRLLTYASEVAVGLAPQARVLYASAHRSDDDPFSPFARLLQECFGLMPTFSPSIARTQVGSAVGEILRTQGPDRAKDVTRILCLLMGLERHPQGTPGAGFVQEASAAVRDFIEGHGSDYPLLLLLDNMHHATPNAWALLSAVVAADAQVSTIVAGEPSIASHLERLSPVGGAWRETLQPFSRSDIGSMLGSLLPSLRAIPEDLIEIISRRTAGNPARVRDAIFDLLEEGVFVQTDQGLAVDSHGLQRAESKSVAPRDILAPLESLSREERTLLERAAVVGETFGVASILVQMRGESNHSRSPIAPLNLWRDDDRVELDRTVESLVRKGLIAKASGTGTTIVEYAFNEPGLRDAIYASTPHDLLATRHAAVARWLRTTTEFGDGLAAMVAPHLERAGLRTQAGNAYLEASAVERSRFHTTVALRYIEQALPLLDAHDLQRRIDALHEYGSLLTTVGRYDGALEALTEMLRAAWTLDARTKGGAALNRIARVYRQRGQNEIAKQLLYRGLELFREAGDLRGVAASLDDLAQVHQLSSDMDAAIETAHEALQIRRVHDDERGEALSLTTIGIIELARGHFDKAEKALRDALTIRRTIEDVEGLMNSYRALGVLAFERADVETAIASWKASLEHARELSDRRTEAVLMAHIGEAFLALGKLDEARDILTRARPVAENLGDRHALADIDRHLGRVAARRNDDDASALLERARASALEYGSKEAIALALRARGVFRAQTLFDAEGKLDRGAEEDLLASVDLFREIKNDREVARSLVELGFFLLERGETDPARERLHEARAILRRMGLRQPTRLEHTLQEIG